MEGSYLDSPRIDQGKDDEEEYTSDRFPSSRDAPEIEKISGTDYQAYESGKICIPVHN